MRKGPVVKNIDQYLEEVETNDARDALARLRRIIRDEVPEAEEVISYGMPMVKYHGMVAGYAAFKKHCSFFPGHTVTDFENELKAFKTSKGTVQFSPDRPIPEDLVRRIVRARADENFAIFKDKQ